MRVAILSGSIRLTLAVSRASGSPRGFPSQNLGLIEIEGPARGLLLPKPRIPGYPRDAPRPGGLEDPRLQEPPGGTRDREADGESEQYVDVSGETEQVVVQE